MCVQEQLYTGTDISLLLKAIHSAQDVINRIKDMRKGMMGSALISIMNEVRTALRQTARSERMNRNTGGMDDESGKTKKHTTIKAPSEKSIAKSLCYIAG